ncbi:MAG TPA: DUF6776 family protein [Steroidobacteraceae bacterium]|nr:DUF6776 family protein [Steroidobacteraceae bacterium]
MPTDTQRLIVKRHAPIRAALVWAIVVVGGIACLVGAFEAGGIRAGYSLLAAQLDRRAKAAQIEELTAQLRSTQARLAEAEVARRVDREAYQQVEKSLADFEARLSSQSQELTFYRGIVNPSDGLAGLRIQRLQILPGIAPHRFRVRLVLIQAARQDAVASGTADLSVDGQRGGRAVNLPLAQIGTSSNSLNFSFRYFQEVETEIELPEDFLPERVVVEVRPAKATASIRQTYPWKIETT